MNSRNPTMNRPPKRQSKHQTIFTAVIAFLFGSILTASVVLNVKVHWHASTTIGDQSSPSTVGAPLASRDATTSKTQRQVLLDTPLPPSKLTADTHQSVLQGTRILIVIVAFDFSQIPHLEEVIDSYHDLCYAGASSVDVVIHATVAYPVTLIDLWNTRFTCSGFSITIQLKPSSLRLHLVDCHRSLFYERIDDYDLFIYTEDDIRARPTTVASYLEEIRRLEGLLEGQSNLKPSDFNVGIVRYEYNYPANVVIDDNTRHATQNVTRVYWEHSGYDRPVVTNAMQELSQEVLQKEYFTMKNHHQGMYLATRDLLLAWKDRENCDFDQARNRPGRGAQPTEGTQRVWMSSQMLYGRRHCNVQQILPKQRFGTLTVLHLPNKNYRRVGKYRNRTFADGSEVFESPHESLLTAMEAHISMRKAWPAEPQRPYRGVQMVDEVDKRRDRTELLDRRMREFEAYVNRGGVLSDVDMEKIALV